VFGDGPRRPLDREQRARFRYLLTAHRRARRLTPTAELIGTTLVRRLGQDGQPDPAHEPIAEDVGCCSRTVRRALEAMRTLGLLLWQRRLVRDGWRVSQTSNAYLLALTASPAEIRVPRCDGQSGRQTSKIDFISVPQASPAEVRAAQAALARRRAATQGRLLTKGALARA
jgi:hypothetical protein